MSIPNNIKGIDLPKISIGLPVYNGEKFLRKRLDSICSQTFTDFELIISDNASTDSTSVICEEYVKKDKRIRYIRQPKNMGPSWNYNFVLKEAKYEFFAWAAVDDMILPDFLGKNIKILLSQQNVVGCISKVELYELPSNELINPIDTTFGNFLRKIRYATKPFAIYPISGSYENKVRFFLKNMVYIAQYCVYRTAEPRRSIVEQSFVADDFATVLTVLRYGNISVLDEVLMYRYTKGASTKGAIAVSRLLNGSTLGILFPFYPFTSWCRRNLGTKIFLRNLDYFVQLNIEGGFSLVVDAIRLLIHKITRK